MPVARALPLPLRVTTGAAALAFAGVLATERDAARVVTAGGNEAFDFAISVRGSSGASRVTENLKAERTLRRERGQRCTHDEQKHAYDT